MPWSSGLFGLEVWGLGTMLYAPNGAVDFIIGHDGNNEPAINTAVRVDPTSGDAIIMLATGHRLLATELAGQWVYWKTRAIDPLAFAIAADRMVQLVIGGWIAILLTATAVLVRRRRRST